MRFKPDQKEKKLIDQREGKGGRDERRKYLMKRGRRRTREERKHRGRKIDPKKYI